jgi:rhamnose utilization protein RhaD (predicted bifunctional aldolase and dehydrogenase)
MRAIAAEAEFRALRLFSAALGRNRLRTQAAGGNTSIKRNGVMWIKASGRWLADAAEDDIMVPVALEALRAAAMRGDRSADSALAFVVHEINPAGLRPSIETSVHAVIPHAVVAHIHCVETIALAVRENVREALAERLSALPGVRWSVIPYRRPGLPLARAILDGGVADADVLILANHGLVVTGKTVAEVERLTQRVCEALATAPRPSIPPRPASLKAHLRDSQYRLPRDEATHGLALDPTNVALAVGAPLYPDHVIFLGPEVLAATDIAAGAGHRYAGAPDQPPPMLVVPGLGVALHRSAPPAADAMALCLADVVARIPADAALKRLSPAEARELTNWDAEKYRQALAAREGA